MTALPRWRHAGTHPAVPPVGFFLARGAQVTDGLRVTMYVDGFNLYYGLLKPNPALRWLDLAARGGAKACPVATTGGSRSSRSPSSSRSIAGPTCRSSSCRPTSGQSESRRRRRSRLRCSGRRARQGQPPLLADGPDDLRRPKPTSVAGHVERLDDAGFDELFDVRLGGWIRDAEQPSDRRHRDDRRPEQVIDKAQEQGRGPRVSYGLAPPRL